MVFLVDNVRIFGYREGIKKRQEAEAVVPDGVMVDHKISRLPAYYSVGVKEKCYGD